MISIGRQERQALKWDKTMKDVSLENVEKLLKLNEEILAEIAEMIKKLKQPYFGAGAALKRCSTKMVHCTILVRRELSKLLNDDMAWINKFDKWRQPKIALKNLTLLQNRRGRLGQYESDV